MFTSPDATQINPTPPAGESDRKSFQSTLGALSTLMTRKTEINKKYRPVFVSHRAGNILRISTTALSWVESGALNTPKLQATICDPSFFATDK